MRILSIGYRKLLRSLERHLADQTDRRKDIAIEKRLATLPQKAAKGCQCETEPMPYRLHIAVAFVSLASALICLYVRLP